MDFEPDYITQTQRGREKVIFRGYAYVKDKNGPNDVSYWRCERKDELFCKGRARMCSGKIKALVGDHNHAPEVERKEVATVRDCIAVHSQETVESTSQIVTSVLAQASFAAVVQLPHTKSLKRQSQRDRIRVQNVPPNPGTLQDLQLPDNYKNTIDGDIFLLYDSGPAAAENRMILFCTEVNLNLLDDSEHWYTDGTFKTVPRLFLQLYTIAVKVNGYYLPLVYALLPNKMQQTYERLLDILIQAKAGIKPESVTMDFEKGAMNAVQVKFPGCEVHGCYFHQSQNIFRHVQTAGLQERYTADAQFAREVRQLAALAFVPLGDVPEFFDHLDATLSEDMDPILEYFEKNYIGILRQNGHRRTPLFPPATWNVHERTIQNDDRTNNCQEGWHRKFSSTIACHHPTIWKLLDGLLAEQAIMERCREREVAGHEAPKKRRKYEDRDKRLRAILRSFENRTKDEFLRGVAANLAFNIML